jgi:hypothetical protein
LIDFSPSLHVSVLLTFPIPSPFPPAVPFTQLFHCDESAPEIPISLFLFAVVEQTPKFFLSEFFGFLEVSLLKCPRYFVLRSVPLELGSVDAVLKPERRLIKTVATSFTVNYPYWPKKKKISGTSIPGFGPNSFQMEMDIHIQDKETFGFRC